jgi:hypothetical protein
VVVDAKTKPLFLSVEIKYVSLDQMLQLVWQLHGKRGGLRVISCCFAQ